MSESLTLVTFNVESGEDTYAARIAEDIVSIADIVDLWGLTEVADKAEARAHKGAAASNGPKYRYILAEARKEDRLAILYRLDKMKLRSVEELDRLLSSRKLLLGHFGLIESGTEFLFVVNHFKRGDPSHRKKQAQRFRSWFNQQTPPLITVGDYNFDYGPR